MIRFGIHPAARDTVSRWLVELVKWCYTYSSSSDFGAVKVRAHDVKALSTSWALFQGVSVNDIMEAASWASSSTFSSFYLKNVVKERGEFSRAVLLSAGR